MRSPARPSEMKLLRQQSVLLFCPYDRKITKHARRWIDHALVCTQCGHSIEVSGQGRVDHFTGFDPSAKTAPFTPPPRPHEPMHWPSFKSNALASAAGVLVVCGLAVALLLTTRMSSNADSSGNVAAATGSAAATENAAEVAGVSVSIIHVGHTGGTGVYLRRTPDPNDRVRAWPDGTALTLMGPDVTQAGMTWKHVQDPAGNQGWVPAEYTDS